MTLDLMFRPTGSGSSSGFLWTPTSQTSNFSPAIGNYVLGDSSGGTFTVTLPASPGTSGGMIAVQKTDTSFTAITIDGNGKNINGAATTTVNTQFERVTLIWNGTAWFLERFIPPLDAAYSASLSGFGTVTVQNIRQNRIGPWLNIYGEFTSGTPGPTLAAISFPVGLVAGASLSASNIGGVYIYPQTSANHGGAILIAAGATALNFGPVSTFSNPSANAGAAALANAITVSGDELSFNIRVLIEAWRT